MANDTPTNEPSFPSVESRVAAALRATLNSHGHGFQHALLRHIEQEVRSSWSIEAVEFPVSYAGGTTHIDAVLRLNAPGGPPCFRIAAECKRANPSLVDWCFVRVPNFPGNDTVSLEKIIVQINDARELVHNQASIDPGSFHSWNSDQGVYNIAVPVKGPLKGDSEGNGRTALDTAVDQAIRGAHGLVEFLVRNYHLLEQAAMVYRGHVLPVVFTTARLWVSDIDLSTADLATGKMNTLNLRAVPWLWLKQNMSPGLAHSIPGNTGRRDSLRDYVLQDYARVVAVVSVHDDGVARFLKNPNFTH